MKVRFRLRHFEYPENMDTECIAMCDIFNSCGLTTEHSCCGHDKGAFYIIFSNKVTTAQVDEFLMLFANKYGLTPFLGKFLMWARKINKYEVAHTWMYEAPSMQFAASDAHIIVKELDLR